MIKEQSYDELITAHYQQVVQQEGLMSTSTMADVITREKEARAIVEFVQRSLQRMTVEAGDQPVTIVDVGCGNGHTLDTLRIRFPQHQFVGIEKSDELRTLAVSRFDGMSNVSILEGDIREPKIATGLSADILICQRVLINLLNAEDQVNALSNILNVVRAPRNGVPGGTLLFIESFFSALRRLNEARGEFGLPAIEPAYHNLYLDDGFFDVPGLSEYQPGIDFPPANFLSTHYFVTRVLHPIFIRDKPIKRNSEFVKFFSQSLKENIGDYSPLKLYVYERV